MDLGAHAELDDEPGGVAQDEGGDEVPVDDVPEAADAPAGWRLVRDPSGTHHRHVPH